MQFFICVNISHSLQTKDKHQHETDGGLPDGVVFPKLWS